MQIKHLGILEYSYVDIILTNIFPKTVLACEQLVSNSFYVEIFGSVYCLSFCKTNFSMHCYSCLTNILKAFCLHSLAAFFIFNCFRSSEVAFLNFHLYLFGRAGMISQPKKLILVKRISHLDKLRHIVTIN